MQFPRIMLRALQTLALIAAVGMGVSFSAEARRGDSEREVLALAVEELTLIEALISDAERRADPEDRLYFDYDLLRIEVREVREGIAEYIDGARTQPRKATALSAEYTRQRDGE